MRTPSTAEVSRKFSTTVPKAEGAPTIPDHRLLRIVGEGSYGEVWLAQNIMGTFRAIKIVYRRNFQDERPFEREFNGIRRFEPVSRLHDSQVDILHVGRGEDFFYYVMEAADDQRTGQDIEPDRYCPKTLASELKLKGRLPFDECVQIGLSLTTALAHLHQKGLIHRDVKPANVIFVDGVTKLADIGLVTDVAATRSYVGTEGFIPPEGPGTAQADIYSLGKVLYEVATGRDRRDFPELPTLLRESAEAVRLIELNEAILRACELDPANRYVSADEMHADLALLQTGKSLKEHRRMERRMRSAVRFGRIAGMVAVLAGVAFYEARQAAKNNNARLVQMNVANGLDKMKAGDTLAALPWFSKAVELAHGDRDFDEINRLRISSIMDHAPRLNQMFFHGGLVRDAQFSPDGHFLLTASFDRTARIWDLRTGRTACPVLKHDDEVLSARYSADGRWVVTASSDHTARVWDASTGKQVGPPLRHAAEVLHAGFSPDGERVITASWDGTAMIWDRTSGKAMGQPFRHDDKVSWAEFSPDGRRALTTSWDRKARLWDLSSGLPIGVPMVHGAIVRLAIFSPDGQRIGTASDDGTARLWDAATGQPLTSPLRHSEGVVSVAFSPDGELFATGSKDYSAQVWDARTGEPVARRLTHENMVRHVAFSPDGRWLITASTDQSARVWNARTGARIAVPMDHAGGIVTAGFSRTGHEVVTAGHDCSVRIWELSGLETGALFLPVESPVVCADFSSDGQYLASSQSVSKNGREGNLAVWKIQMNDGNRPSGQLIREIPIANLGWDAHVQFFPGHSWLLYTDRPTANLWDFQTGRDVIAPLSHHQQNHSGESGIYRARISPDCRRIATVSTDREARVWDLATRQPITPLLEHSNRVYSVAFSPDGRRLATGCGSAMTKMNGYARVWEIETGRPLTGWLSHPAAVMLISFSPDGRQLLTGCDDYSTEAMGAQIWDADSGQPVGFPLLHGDGIMAARYSLDGKRIVTASQDRTARVWDAVNGRPVTPPLEHPQAVQDAAFSADSRLVVTACLDGSVRVWDAVNGQPITPSFGFTGGGERAHFSISFDTTGRRILGGSGQALRDVLAPHGTRSDRASGPAAGIWNIAPSILPTPELTELSEILGGRSMDSTGALVPADPLVLEQKWYRFRTRHPELFDSSPATVTAWHQFHAAECERDELWFAAKFHLDSLLAIHPGDLALLKRRAIVEASLSQHTDYSRRTR